MRPGKIRRQPRQQQIETVVVRREAQREPANSPLPHQISKRRSPRGPRLVFRLRAAAHDEFPLFLREPFVFTRVSVVRVEEREIEQADEAGRRKTPPPPKM